MFKAIYMHIKQLKNAKYIEILTNPPTLRRLEYFTYFKPPPLPPPVATPFPREVPVGAGRNFQKTMFDTFLFFLGSRNDLQKTHFFPHRLISIFFDFMTISASILGPFWCHVSYFSHAFFNVRFFMIAGPIST